MEAVTRIEGENQVGQSERESHEQILRSGKKRRKEGERERETCIDREL
jgi:hypothetical protein